MFLEGTMDFIIIIIIIINASVRPTSRLKVIRLIFYEYGVRKYIVLNGVKKLRIFKMKYRNFLKRIFTLF